MEVLARLRWLFRRSKTMQLLYQIESHKTGINIILQIMILAAQTREMSTFVVRRYICLIRLKAD